MTYNVTPLVQAMIGLCAVFITAIVIPYIRAKHGNENMEEFLAWVEIGVAAAEQLYNQTDGKAKKAYVLTFLANKGYLIDEDEVDKAIEAAVLGLHTSLYGAANE